MSGTSDPVRPHERARVLVVDDSTVVRRFLAEALGADPDLEVVATAPNGRIALSKVRASPPDVVTLDLEMPDLDGIETLVALRREYRDLPVLICSAHSERGAAATFDALAKGATDYVTKPSLASGGPNAHVRFAEELVSKVRALARRRPVREPTAAIPAPRPPAAARARIEVIAVAVSTGGPNALAAILPALPATLPVPVLIVQHMPPLFTRMLADRLTAAGPLPVREATHGEIVVPGAVYIAPGDKHMTVRRQGRVTTIALNQGPPENSCRPAADVLFRSVADAYGPAALALVLTGMGRDGFLGSEAIVARGGRVLAQDAATSVVWGMPGFVAEAGLAEQVLPLGEIARALGERASGRPS